MKLNQLLDVDDNREVSYLSEDSRDVKKNTLFFCLKGAAFDTHSVVDEVIEKGANVIVHTDFLEKKDGIFYYQTDDIEEVMAKVCANFFDEPSKKMNLVGITGTNGKTTSAWILKDILNKISSCGYIGTINIEYNEKVFKNLFTTPKPIELNYHLNEMVKDEIKYCALEVSSHALTLKRTEYLNFKYAIMTNLSFEHVNFHGSMSEYAKAKRMLFEQLSENSYAILNKDDETYDDYQKSSHAKVISYGINNDADVMAKDIIISNKNTKFILVIFDKEYKVETNLVALFNVYNLLSILCVLYLEGYDIEKILPLLKSITYPKGRMEAINENQNFDVIIDYAHTPDGFEKVFEYAKEMAKGRIIAVFGSAGGDRDKEKRPILGEIASNYCDEIILTEEDIRDETTQSIALEIKKGIKNDVFTKIIDKREDAIKYVIDNAKKDDMILILAKADDRYNIVQGKAIPYEGDINLTTRLLKERRK
ncbi:UDP-N-acetylmuramoyl-L-alanyl-D-glutamate--2,6-diaminopimelate ligase [Bacilli bacterium PM5-3]|nr:UDP-N-acetylmuramoyl-L-alanyl-D-glutamate--2,6-diaminopimelate ligase [Bacilli bacterium PM5-3]